MTDTLNWNVLGSLQCINLFESAKICGSPRPKIFGIPLKPSSALVFSIVFGISVDYSIHFLAKFKNELLMNKDIKVAVINTIEETGRSMIFTSFILFFGFIIFAFSSFGGTIVLGVLTSIILFVAMITNLTLLPSIILFFYNSKN